MRLAWLTDIHLNFLSKAERTDFYDLILEKNPSVILITGDIAESKNVRQILEEMQSYLGVPIHFVLGNHDFYHSSIKAVREDFINNTQPFLYYLSENETIMPTDDVLIFGADGFADGYYGDFHNTRIRMNDHHFIEEFNHARLCSNTNLLNEMRKQSTQDVEKLSAHMMPILEENCPKSVIILTHIPPFEECCLYGGKRSGKDYLPFYSSKLMGDKLSILAETYKNTNFLVLCGHTHSKAIYQPLPNLTVRVGEAEYTEPRINMLEIKEDGAIVFDDE